MLKKLLFVTIFAVCGTVFSAEDYLDCIRLVNQWLDANYRGTPYAYKAGCEKLGKIIGSDKPEIEKIAELKKAFPRAFKKEEKPLIVQQPLSWSVHSLSLAFDIKEGEIVTRSDVDVLDEVERMKASVERTDGRSKSSSHHGEAGIGADAGANLSGSGNPFKWLGNAQAKIGISGSYRFVQESVNKHSELWSESQQQTFSSEHKRILEIINQREISKLHLTFTLTVTNNTDEEMTIVLTGAYIPVYMGSVSCNKNAEPYGHKTGSITIGKRESKDVVFRMELDTTTARELVGFMCQYVPTIDITRGFLQIGSKRYPNAVTSCRSSHTETRLVKLRMPVFDAEWNIRSYHTSDQRSVTLREALTAIDDDIHSGWKHHMLDWQDNTLAAISDIPLSSFAAEDKGGRYLAFLQVGDKIYSRIPAELLDETKPLPTDGVILWVVDLNHNDYKNATDTLKKAIFEKLRELANQNSAVAQFRFAVCYQYGLGVKQDFKQADHWYQKAAERGLAIAQWTLAIYEKDPEQALYWCQKAANQELAVAQWMLGRVHIEGIAGKKDESKGVVWLKKAAEQGYVNAQIYLANYYGHKNDVPNLVFWIKKAAAQENAEAQFVLGLFYLSGTGVPKDEHQAVEWIRKAAEQGYDKAQTTMGWVYYNGFCVPKDLVTAAGWFRKAAEQGNAEAQNKLGECYYEGEGVPLDYTKAVHWFVKAANQGYAAAQYNVGVCYQLGRGKPFNYKDAVEWYKKSADQGHPQAQRRLGECYLNGRGVKQNYQLARSWICKAANQGDAEAQFLLGTLYFSGTSVPEDKKQAFEWFQKSAEKGFKEAQKYLAVCYFKGWGVKRDPNKSKYWFDKAEGR